MKRKKSALLLALLVTFFSVVNVAAAETVPAKSIILHYIDDETKEEIRGSEEITGYLGEKRTISPEFQIEKFYFYDNLPVDVTFTDETQHVYLEYWSLPIITVENPTITIEATNDFKLDDLIKLSGAKAYDLKDGDISDKIYSRFLSSDNSEGLYATPGTTVTSLLDVLNSEGEKSIDSIVTITVNIVDKLPTGPSEDETTIDSKPPVKSEVEVASPIITDSATHHSESNSALVPTKEATSTVVSEETKSSVNQPAVVNQDGTPTTSLIQTNIEGSFPLMVAGLLILVTGVWLYKRKEV